MTALDTRDRQIILALQGGLPLDVSPWERVAEMTGMQTDEVLSCVADMLRRGAIRRIAAVPNHFRLGMVANGMSVWDVEDDRVADLGRQVGALPFVTHCYRRPRHMPDWPYNLFAMLHGATREEVEAKRADVAALLGSACRGNDILYSTRILKKTGMRLHA